MSVQGPTSTCGGHICLAMLATCWSPARWTASPKMTSSAARPPARHDARRHLLLLMREGSAGMNQVNFRLAGAEGDLLDGVVGVMPREAWPTSW